jgi:hypothetical protein
LLCYSTIATLLRPKPKKQKAEHISSWAVIKTRKGPTKDKDFKRMRVLFDSGCAATLVNQKVEEKRQQKH